MQAQPTSTDLTNRIDRAQRIIETNPGDGAERRIRIDARKTLLRLNRELKALAPLPPADISDSQLLDDLDKIYDAMTAEHIEDATYIRLVTAHTNALDLAIDRGLITQEHN